MSRWSRKPRPEPEPDETTQELVERSKTVRRQLAKVARELGDHVDDLREFVAHARREEHQQ